MRCNTSARPQNALSAPKRGNQTKPTAQIAPPTLGPHGEGGRTGNFISIPSCLRPKPSQVADTKCSLNEAEDDERRADDNCKGGRPQLHGSEKAPGRAEAAVAAAWDFAVHPLAVEWAKGNEAVMKTLVEVVRGIPWCRHTHVVCV